MPRQAENLQLLAKPFKIRISCYERGANAESQLRRKTICKAEFVSDPEHCRGKRRLLINGVRLNGVPRFLDKAGSLIWEDVTREHIQNLAEIRY